MRLLNYTKVSWLLVHRPCFRCSRWSVDACLLRTNGTPVQRFPCACVRGMSLYLEDGGKRPRCVCVCVCACLRVCVCVCARVCVLNSVLTVLILFSFFLFENAHFVFLCVTIFLFTAFCALLVLTIPHTEWAAIHQRLFAAARLFGFRLTVCDRFLSSACCQM